MYFLSPLIKKIYNNVQNYKGLHYIFTRSGDQENLTTKDVLFKESLH